MQKTTQMQNAEYKIMLQKSADIKFQKSANMKSAPSGESRPALTPLGICVDRILLLELFALATPLVMSIGSLL